jgi:hypothetical protein
VIQKLSGTLVNNFVGIITSSRGDPGEEDWETFDPNTVHDDREIIFLIFIR